MSSPATAAAAAAATATAAPVLGTDGGAKSYKIPKIKCPNSAIKIYKIFSLHFYLLYLVGGAVRDAAIAFHKGLEPKEPHDFDFATNATPEQILLIFANEPNYKVEVTGDAFPVVRIKVLATGDEFEIATFREDVYDGVVRTTATVTTEGVTAKGDAQRRDFRVNALFYILPTDDLETGEVLDFVGGWDDIQNGIIRTVGNPADRFGEDRLRILRALRFAAKLGFALEENLIAYLLSIPKNKLSGLSFTRIRDEFKKGVESAISAIHFLELLNEYNLFSEIFPGIENINTSNFPQSNNWFIQLGHLLSKVAIDDKKNDKLLKVTLAFTDVDITWAKFVQKILSVVPEIEIALLGQYLDGLFSVTADKIQVVNIANFLANYTTFVTTKSDDIVPLRKSFEAQIYKQFETTLIENILKNYCTLLGLDLTKAEKFLTFSLSVKGNDPRLGSDKKLFGEKIKEFETELWKAHLSNQ